MMPTSDRLMADVVLKLPDCETLTLSQDEARALLGRLWTMRLEPGAAPMAVKLTDASSPYPAYGRVVDVTEREHNALRVVLSEPPQS